MLRLTVTLLLILAVFLLPWYITVSALLVSMLFFNPYLEVLGIAVLFDLYYGVSVSFLPIPALLTFAALVMLAILAFARKSVRLVS